MFYVLEVEVRFAQLRLKVFLQHLLAHTRCLEHTSLVGHTYSLA